MKAPAPIWIGLLILWPTAWTGCRSHETGQARTIDSLRTLVETLKPGLGEFMIQLKYHHDRLGEAIAGKDIPKAAYEAGEMQETAEKAIQLRVGNDKLRDPFPLQYDRFLRPSLTAVRSAAENKDLPGLSRQFTLLTEHCNACHQANNMEFMRILPDGAAR